MAGLNKGSTFVATYGTSSPIVATAPTDLTDGQPLDGLSAVRCVVSAASGQTLTGGGVLLGYIQDPAVLTADGVAQANGGSGLADTSTLTYNTQTANFTVGLRVSGATSKANGIISADVDAGTTGTLTITGTLGTFVAGEIITDTSTGSATVAAAATKALTYDGQVTAFEVGMTVRGLTSGAKGVVTADSGTVLTLTWTPTIGVFIDNEGLVGVSAPRWVRWEAADLQIPNDAGALRDMATVSFSVLVPRKAKALWVPDSVVFSGGTGVTVFQLGQTSTGLHDAGSWGG